MESQENQTIKKATTLKKVKGDTCQLIDILL